MNHVLNQVAYWEDVCCYFYKQSDLETKGEEKKKHSNNLQPVLQKQACNTLLFYVLLQVCVQIVRNFSLFITLFLGYKPSKKHPKASAVQSDRYLVQCLACMLCCWPSPQLWLLTRRGICHDRRLLNTKRCPLPRESRKQGTNTHTVDSFIPALSFCFGLKNVLPFPPPFCFLPLSFFFSFHSFFFFLLRLAVFSFRSR